MQLVTTRRRTALLGLLAAALTALVAASAALAAPPRSTSPPEISGTYREGSTLTASTGSWSNGPTSFSYRWLRCDNEDCRRISGATSRRYQLVARDVGRALVVEVTARNADGARTARSAFTPLIAANVPPQNTAPPTISGTPVVGGTLSADPGTWSGAPTFTFVWLRCDAAGGACADTGSRGRTYGVRAEDVGRTLRVEVRARNPRGTTRATSAQTGVVRAATGGPAIPVALVSLPDRLVISGVSFTPKTIPNRTTTITLRVRVSDTRGRLIQGAAVFASGLPFGRVTQTPETVTNGQGIATITFRPTARLPMVRGASVVFFLRARKPGENPLAGVSTRRLVQVTVRPA
jgi:hypothetical protein